MPASRNSPARRAAADFASLPAPTAGWNAKDPLSKMRPDYAPLLDNWFPVTGAVQLRKGFARYATGLGLGSVETLMAWAGAASSKLFGVSGGSIYDVSSSGAVGAAAVSGLSNSRFYHTMFGAGGGQYLYACNGLDSPRAYDGSSWTTPTITAGSGSLTPSNLIYPWAFKSRLFFVEKNTAKAWYLPTLSIAGAAQPLDFTSLFTKGGYLVAGGALSRDSAGAGMGDHCVFVSSNGQVLIYQGTDPASASTWALVYRLDIGAPVGGRPLVQFGGDLMVITQDGYVPLTALISQDRSQAGSFAVSDKINPAVRLRAAGYKQNFGWGAIVHQAGSMLLVNVPLAENSRAEQHVMNTVTGAWCRYTGLNANCWAVFNDALYFGGQSGVVYQAETGASDDGGNVVGDLKTAWSELGAPARQKQVTMMRPLLVTDTTISPGIEMQMDFADAIPSNTPTVTGAAGSAWDTSPWDTSPWGSDGTPQTASYSAAGVGIYASLRMRVATKATSVILNGFSVAYKVGGFL